MAERDPEALQALADATVQRAADALRLQLKEVAALIDPFPPFPGAVFAYGIEVEPPGGGDPDLGCVILGNDGALYELHIGIDATQVALAAGASGERHEDLTPLDLEPARYVAYAHAAVHAATAYLGAQGGQP